MIRSRLKELLNTDKNTRISNTEKRIDLNKRLREQKTEQHKSTGMEEGKQQIKLYKDIEDQKTAKKTQKNKNIKIKK